MQKYKRILYKETEDKLYKYFNRDRIYKGLNSQLTVLNKQIDELSNELKDCKYINVDEESSSPGFDERVQTSSSCTSYVESQVIKLTDMKLRRKEKKELERENILSQLGDLESIIAEMEWKVGQLRDNYKKMLSMVYKDNMNEVQISFKLHLSQSQVNKRKNKILEHIFMWEKWN
ncbi:hypothetical protein FDB15_18560 [Clostridium botulinum]|uniref:hypothetical protein n=1 Tax=unclassified Clostridium TaxID=2614128 RepID=UPI000540CFEE|nr:MULTISPECIES: hypothetical protein [unclassified Clostridium]AIY81684.1 hypothetical protein U728_1684 [Clostridium botulinum 202F]KAI3347969.1 hypothetical protein CIT17_06860 [Clostridium botulinum]KON14102.1 hypothetical protein ACP50_04125 [Clostridium botulinum]MBY6986433.1 hypothetical protein [Clostridium botulinum]MBY7009077.1 hypothetical protein [Clostridium botulinum]